jgi:hypothetical protein
MITVNDTSNPVNAGSSMTVAVANGPGNATDWKGICNTETPSSPNCGGAGYGWDYLKLLAHGSDDLADISFLHVDSAIGQRQLRR